MLKAMQATPTSGYVPKAFTVHGVACHGPWQVRIQEVERVFGRKGGGVIGVWWLLQQHRRREKVFTSLVIILKRAVGTAKSMYVKMQG